jgi:hypothetical protein
MSHDDRRTAPRIPAIVLVELDASGRHGVTRDASDRGLLVSTRYRVSPGELLSVTIHGPTGPIRTLARVVRVDETPPADEWRYRVALELDEELPQEVIEAGMNVAATFLSRPSGSPPK